MKIVITKREDNNNYEYENKINQRLMQNKINCIDPDRAKKIIKYKPIRKFEEDYFNLPTFLVQKLKEIFNIEENYYETLKNYLHNYKNNSLYHELYDFLKYIKCKYEDIEKIIDYIVDKIYEELVFDNK